MNENEGMTMRRSTNILVELSGWVVFTMALAGVACGPSTDEGGDESAIPFPEAESNSDAGPSDSTAGSNPPDSGTVPGGSSDANLIDSGGSEEYQGPTSNLSDAECKQFFRRNFGQNHKLISVKTTEDIQSNDPRDYLCDRGDKCIAHTLHFRTDGQYSQLFRIVDEFRPSDTTGDPEYGYCHEGYWEVTGCNEIQFETCTGNQYTGSWWVYPLPNEDRELLILTAPFEVDGDTVEYTGLFEAVSQSETFDEFFCLSTNECQE